MSDRRLQVFYSVARNLSFTKAAEALHMTQPAVTFQVRQLEEQFNTRLFDRTHNRINLTEAGERVYRYAKQIFELYSRMEGEVRELTGEVSGVVIVGASTTIAEYMLPSLLGDFKRKFADVVIRLRVSNTDGIVAMVEDNEIDLGVVEGPVPNKSLVVEVCRIDKLVAVLSPEHELAGRASLPVADVLKYPFIAREEGSGTREVIFDYLRGAGLEPADLTLVMELGSPESIKGAIEAGMGISILSRSTIGKELQLATLACVELDPALERPFSFVHQKQKFRARAIEELLDFARSYCRQEDG
ncbi:MAG: selenium metabolism-associated LysR family transcriptional regulator [Gammaproteobacteria bacterium]|nr:MAG: selenium metabolism-associated LysR family transcriptional regulator [Gammaproteobacteria bacterium]